MKNLAKQKTFSDASSATVVDGNLILTLPDALNPVVWRLELSSVKASAMEVREGADKKTFTLVLKTPKGETHDIAPYDSREKALEALMKISAALQGAQGRIVPFAAAPATAPTFAAQPEQKKTGGGWKWILALAGVIAVIVLFSWIGTVTSRGVVSSAGPAASGGAQTGVPESADDVLRGF